MLHWTSQWTCARFQIEHLVRLEIQRQHDVQAISSRALDAKAAVVMQAREQWRVDAEDTIMEHLFYNPVLRWFQGHPKLASVGWSDNTFKEVLVAEIESSSQRMTGPLWAHQELTLWSLLRSSKQEPYRLLLRILRTCRGDFSKSFPNNSTSIHETTILSRLSEIYRHYSASVIQRVYRNRLTRQMLKAKIQQLANEKRLMNRRTQQVKLHRASSVLQACVRACLARSNIVRAFCHRIAQRLAAVKIARWYYYWRRMKRGRAMWKKRLLVERVVAIHQRRFVLRMQRGRPKQPLTRDAVAAICFQRFFRGWQARRAASLKRRSIIKIQSVFRRCLAMRNVFWKRAFASHRRRRARQKNWQIWRAEFTNVQPIDQALVLMNLYTDKEIVLVQSEAEREKKHLDGEFKFWQKEMTTYFLKEKKLKDIWIPQLQNDGTYTYFNVDTGRSQADHPHLKIIAQTAKIERGKAEQILAARLETLNNYIERLHENQRWHRANLFLQRAQTVVRTPHPS
jgi:hypothetical protein